MRQEVHDCLGHAAVGGVVEGVVALSEVVPRRAASAILVQCTHCNTDVNSFLHITHLMGSMILATLSATWIICLANGLLTNTVINVILRSLAFLLPRHWTTRKGVS